MFANVHRSKASFTQVPRLQNYDGSLQKMTKMLLDLEVGKTRDHRENVTSIIENLADRKDMCTPHDDDEKWADMFRDTVSVDDVNGGNELGKHLVIEARKTEMEFFKKLEVYRKGITFWRLLTWTRSSGWRSSSRVSTPSRRRCWGQSRS